MVVSAVFVRTNLFDSKEGYHIVGNKSILLEYIQADEYVEVTPENIRLRKILLDENERKRAKK